MTIEEALQDWVAVSCMVIDEGDESEGVLFGDAGRLFVQTLVAKAAEVGIMLDTYGQDFTPRNRWHWKADHEIPLTDHGYCTCKCSCKSPS